MASWTAGQEELGLLQGPLPLGSSCGAALVFSGLVATTSLLTPARSMWPVAFLLCSVAAALAATRKPEDEDSRVTISYLSRGRSGGGGRRRVGGVGGSGGAEIEGLAFPLEKKEWIYPAQ